MEFSTSRVGEEDKRSGNSQELVEDNYVTPNFGNYFNEERDQRASANTEIAFKTLLCAMYSGMRGPDLKLRAYYSARGTRLKTRQTVESRAHTSHAWSRASALPVAN